MPAVRTARVILVAAGAAAAIAPIATASNPFATQPKADDVFYHIMPIAWRDGPDSDAIDPNRFGDLKGMREGLGYLEALGITAVWMNPIFPSPAYHGYQHGRGDQINPRFGTEQDFLDLIADAKSRDIELYLDFVVYGISHDTPYFQNAFGNSSSQFDDELAFTNAFNTEYLGSRYNTWNGDSVGFIHWDLRNPDTVDRVTDWSLKWLDPNGDGDPEDGIAGYRLDHVWVNYGSGPDGWGYNLDDFWATWHAALRQLKPDVFTFAEQHNWGSHGAEYLAEFDAAMTKPFEFAARDALWSESAAPLYGQMEQTIATLQGSGFAGQRTYVGIIGDHDVDRLATSIGADNQFTIGRAEAAAAVLLLQPFPPIIYYGDEIAMTGFKMDYGSDANDIPMREPFKWNAVEGAPMSRYQQLNSFARNNMFSADNDGRSVDEQQTSGPLAAHRELIALRHANTALRRGSYHAIDASNGSVWAFLRRYEQGEAPIPDASQALACAINLRGTTVSTTLDLSDFVAAGATLSVTNAATGDPLPSLTPGNASNYTITIPPHGFVLLEADFRRPPEPPIALNGTLDDAYTEIVASPGGSLWAAFDGDTLFLATNPAGDGRDRFIVVSDNPNAGTDDAPWAKLGTVASYDAYIGNEADNNWTGWFDAVAPGGPFSGQVLEGSIDLALQYGALPDTIYVAALSYYTLDGEPLDPFFQVPAGNGDGDVQAGEFFALELASLAPQCTADLTTEGTNPGDAGYGTPDGTATVSDLTFFVEAWVSGDATVADLTTEGTNPGDASYGTPDGSVTVTDLTFFVEAWIGGCA
ncbi:MAG: alpha-amylase family glycosyl hydrolase [Planctomycetota bacterium]